MQEYASWIGILTAIIGNVLISFALNLQKYVHSFIKERNEPDNEYDYLEETVWWIGMVLLLIGEVGNFIAYSFASAAIVAPLGTVALIANTIFAPLMLKEKFRKRDLYGIIFAIVGAVLVVTSAKQDEKKIDSDALLVLLKQTKFVLYFLASIVIAGTLITFNDYFGPRFILTDLTIVGIAAGFTVLATKSMSSLLSSHSFGMLAYGITYIVIFVLIFSGVVQIHYLNKAMARFESTQVVPIQFVLFTLFAIIGSAILFNDFVGFDASQFLYFLFGCALIFTGVYFITSQRSLPDAPLIPSITASLLPSPTSPVDISSHPDIQNEYFLSRRHRLTAKSMDGLGLLTTGLGNQSVRYALDHRNGSNSLPKYPIQL